MRRYVLLVAALIGLAGCDFAPTFSVPTPDFEPGLVFGGVLVADSAVALRVTFAANPYRSDLPPPAQRPTVVLLRDGQPVETLRSAPCPSPYGNAPGETDCGWVTGQTVIAAGTTYTLRATAPGLPTAEATVTVPARPAVTASVAPSAGTVGGQPADRVRLVLTDPPGPHRYYLDVVRLLRYTFPVYGPDGPTSRDTTITGTSQAPYTTTNPVLIAAARYIPPDGVRRILFEDRAFDGTAWAATLDVLRFETYAGGPEPIGPPRLRLFSVDVRVAEAYLAQEFGFIEGGPTPFAEPGNGPTNVTGGYGLVAGVALAEVPLPTP